MVTMLNGVHAPPRQIRFVHSQGQPPAKRRRINAARKTRCFGERPVCSTCTKNNHACQGYSDEADKKPYREGAAGLDDADGDMLGRAGVYENHSDDGRDERRHSKSKLGAARLSSSTAGGPPLRRDADAGLRRTTALESPRNSSWNEATQRQPQDGESADASASFKWNTNTMARSRHRRDSKVCSVPYFRYFGPTAIIPGFRKVVVSVKSRRRSYTTGSLSGSSPGPALGPSEADFSDHIKSEALPADGLPIYDPGDPRPVPSLIQSLVQTFFLHLGSNYPCLRPERFYKLVNEKRVEPILVDAVCALAARFSDSSVFARGDDGLARSEYGQFYAQRAKAATVHTFSCPSVGVVQAFLLMACDGLGASQDSAPWIYLGLAIRMAIDLGLQKVVGIKYQGEENLLFTRHRDGRTVANEGPDDDGFELEAAKEPENSLSPDEQKEVEQERIDTLWAIFTLDRVVSSATGRPVTFRDDDFELSLPEPSLDPTTGWPDAYPHFIRIIHVYGRVSDVMNSTNYAKELTDEKWDKLATMEAELTKQHQALDQRLECNAGNFRAHVTAGKATTFVLLHFWFHALIIVLHHPTLLSPLGGLSRRHQPLSNSRELAMSSAKAIADILAFAELIDPKSLVGNPFTSQPMYIAACAFLMESAVNASKPDSPAASPPETDPGPSRPHGERQPGDSRSSSSTHSLLASSANQNYQRCYDALTELRRYWAGVGYVLAALDQKSAGAWDVETYTRGGYGGTGTRHLSPSAPRSSGAPPATAWSLAGTADAPGSSNLSLMYQDTEGERAALQMGARLPPAETPQGPAVPGGSRQGRYPQPTTTSAPRPEQRPRRPATEAQTPTRALRALEHMSPCDTITPPPSVDRASDYAGAMSQPYTPSSHSPAGYEPAAMQGASPAAAAGHQAVGRCDSRPHQGFVDGYRGMYAQHVMTFDGQGMGMGGMGGMQGEIMPGWMAYLPAMDMYGGMGG